MAKYKEIDVLVNDNNKLYVYEDIFDIEIKRFFFITELTQNQIRGNHINKNSFEGIVCVKGSFTVIVKNGEEELIFDLYHPNQCLLVEPGEWHKIYNFEEGSILFAFSDTKYDKEQISKQCTYN